MSKVRIKPNQFQTFDKNLIEAGELLELQISPIEELENLKKNSSNSFKINSIAIGKIIEKYPDHVVLDINYKSNGQINSYEFNAIEYQALIVGSEVEVLIEELENEDGQVVLSYEKAKSTKSWNRIVELYDQNKPVEGIVTSKVKGGLYVDIGINAFLPGSQIDTQRVIDFDQWIGQKIQAYIIKIIPKRGNVILSRRKYVYEQKSEVRKEILDTLTEGQIISGIVKNITKYGAFIDIGGVDGLLHITDMTWSRIDDPSEILSIGDSINVKLLSFDKENEKISLGLKQLSENPWEQLPESIEVGSTVTGKIISIKDYGIFVEIIKGVEGLIHISEISWTDRISDLNKHFKIGQSIEAHVVSFEQKNRRMSLSIKQLEKNPWEAIFEKYEIGQKISGKVTNIADFGFFIQLAPGVDGLVHISDISWTQHIKHPADLYKKDDMVEAVIIDINKPKRKVSLSIKALKENPWEKIKEELPVGGMIDGEIINITDFGAFVKLDKSNIEAFIHSSEALENSTQKLEDIFTVGQKYAFKVIRVSPEEQKVGLSVKKEVEKKPVVQQQHKEKPKEFKKEKAVSSATSSSNSSKKNSLQLELEKLMKKE